MSTAKATAAIHEVDPLLVAEEGHIECLLGNEAIVRGALEAGVGFACGYPGTPSSEVTDSFARIAAKRKVDFHYSINEKIALEMSFAACLTGVRAICAMKHLGLMFAGDPLSTIPYVGVVGGLVIVSAGDPSCYTSPNEQDQRHLGTMLYLPILDPSTPQQAHEMTRLAFELSEQSELPVLLRVTARVAHSRAAVRYGRLSEPRRGRFVRNAERFVPIPRNARRLRRAIPGRLLRARRLMSDAGLFRQSGQGRQAILSAGSPAALCSDLLLEHGLGDQVIHATVGGVYPLPEPELLELLGAVDRVLVVEELSPYLEDALRALAAGHGLAGVTILGKRTGHLPEEFEYGPEIIQRGIRAALGLGPALTALPPPPELPPRPPILCPGCPHRATYFAARSAFPADQLYFSDIGCYTLGYGPPLDTADALLCMGAGITLAAGVSRTTGQRTVGFIGDSTFFHAGMPALLNSIKENDNLVVVVLDNQVTAMTGFQQSPSATLPRARPPRRANIEGVVRALGADHVETIDPTELPTAIMAFERARDATGVSVIIAEHPCPVHTAREIGSSIKRGSYFVDESRCQSCGRDSCGLRCDQGTCLGLERHMARGRALELPAKEEPVPSTSQIWGPDSVLDAAEEITIAVAACTLRCPLALCIQGYIGHIAAGDFHQAYELILSRNPLADSVCRVCHRPCESVCVRSETDQPIAINDLKRFVLDWASEQGLTYAPPREPASGKKVAVIGAGPAGLTAAHDLHLRGHEVTIFDAAHEPGGLLRGGIPRFRLPAAALGRDIDRILGLGIAFEGGCRLGRDISLGALLEGGFDAVFVAVGAGGTVELGVARRGEGQLPELIDALRYLELRRDDSASGQGGAGSRVVVVGGGNAAIDAARTAVRLGARSVTIAYRRRRAEMPALPEEVAAALAEGVVLEAQMQPLALESEPEPGLWCVRTEPGPPDPSGRRRPLPIAGSDTLLAADQIIVAIGQRTELSFLSEHAGGLKHTPAGGIAVDPLTGQTTDPRVFAGGDVTAGARTVTDAMADGQRAAWAIDRRLRGSAAADRRPPPPPVGSWPDLPEEIIDAARVVTRADNHLIRAEPATLPLRLRAGGFDEVVRTLTEAQARREAGRCLICGQCGSCRACIDVFGCPAFYLDSGRVRIDKALCIGCGLCARFCPNGAIKPLVEPAGSGKAGG